MSAFEINEAYTARVLPDIKIDSLVSKPISLRDLTKALNIDLKKFTTNRNDNEN
jgi:hypothetical protein